MKVMPWLVMLSLTTVACSGSKSAQKVSEETPQIELSDADEFIENPSEEQPAEATAATEEPAATEDAVVEDTTQDATADAVASNEPLVQESSLENAPAVSNFEPGAMKEYKVEKNETLMMIAFKLYGDYGRWKELANHNQDVLKGASTTRTGMTLKYVAPAEEFVWNPQGNPYLIRTGDTLGGISKQVYATMSKWKLLWENNKPLIKDPNKIYAGFTIYYQDGGREVANEL